MRLSLTCQRYQIVGVFATVCSSPPRRQVIVRFEQIWRLIKNLAGVNPLYTDLALLPWNQRNHYLDIFYLIFPSSS